MNRSSIEAVLTDEGHKARATQGSRADAARLDSTPHQREHLRTLGAEWDNHSALGRELFDEGRWYLGTAGGYEDRIVRGGRAPSQRSVADEQCDVSDGRRSQRRLCRCVERGHPLDGE